MNMSHTRISKAIPRAAMSQRGLYNALNMVSVEDSHSLLLPTFLRLKPTFFS